MNSLKGKSAIVCGGTAGVGLATVDALVAPGCRVGVIARNEDRLREVESAYGRIPGIGPRVVAASADVSDNAGLQQAVATLVERIGAPEIWVNCAMLTSFSRFQDVEPAEFERIVDVTFIGQVNGCRAALRHMATGTIVNVGSGLGYRAVPLQAAYCASKHAINGFTASLRSELIRDRSPIRLSLVQLPALNTPQFDWARNRLADRPQPAPPIYAPTVAAEAIVRAARDAPRELLVGRSVLQLAAGQALAPDWLDHKLAGDGAEMQKSDRPDPGRRDDNLWHPVPMPARAQGSYSDRSEDSALVVDGDQIRFAGVAAVAAAGVAVGLMLAGLRVAPRGLFGKQP